MRRNAVVLLLLAPAIACDIRFVEVGDQTGTAVSVVSHHQERLDARLRLLHQTSSDGIPTLSIGDAPVDVVQKQAGVWFFADTVVLDSLDPAIEVTFAADGESRRIRMPLLARRGSARWLPTGELFLPITRAGGILDRRDQAWHVVVLDWAGLERIRLSGDGALPDSLVLPGALIPDEAPTAIVELRYWASITVGPPIQLSITSRASMPIPPPPG